MVPKQTNLIVLEAAPPNKPRRSQMVVGRLRRGRRRGQMTVRKLRVEDPRGLRYRPLNLDQNMQLPLKREYGSTTSVVVLTTARASGG